MDTRDDCPDYGDGGRDDGRGSRLLPHHVDAHSVLVS